MMEVLHRLNFKYKLRRELSMEEMNVNGQSLDS